MLNKITLTYRNVQPNCQTPPPYSKTEFNQQHNDIIKDIYGRRRVFLCHVRCKNYKFRSSFENCWHLLSLKNLSSKLKFIQIQQLVGVHLNFWLPRECLRKMVYHEWKFVQYLCNTHSLYNPKPSQNNSDTL